MGSVLCFWEVLREPPLNGFGMFLGLPNGALSILFLANWWAIGAVASATPLHGAGRRFESCIAHQIFFDNTKKSRSK